MATKPASISKFSAVAVRSDAGCPSIAPVCSGMQDSYTVLFDPQAIRQLHTKKARWSSVCAFGEWERVDVECL